jgi:hypothetical protein
MVGAVPTLGVIGKLPTKAQTNCERPYWYRMHLIDACVGAGDTSCKVSSPSAGVSDATASMSTASENPRLSKLNTAGRRGLREDADSSKQDAFKVTSSSRERLDTLFLRAAPCSEQRIRYKKDSARVVSMPWTTDFQ